MPDVTSSVTVFSDGDDGLELSWATTGPLSLSSGTRKILQLLKYYLLLYPLEI
jgi:hypothetical protein